MIRIETEKIISKGEKKIKVLGIEALEEEQLPLRYLKREGSIWLSPCRSELRTKGRIGYITLLKINQAYTSERFEKNLESIRAAGELLKKINAELAEENAGWEGKEVYVI